MVALAENGFGGLSAEREMELWTRIRASGQFRGSLPGLIALEARSRGLVPRIWQDPMRIAQKRDALGAIAAFDVATLLRQHEEALAAARTDGVPIEEGATDPPSMVQAMREGEALMVAFAVPAGGGKIGLHWRLYRFVEGTIWEMDPAGGVESPKGESQFVELLTGPSYIGLSVSLRRR